MTKTMTALSGGVALGILATLTFVNLEKSSNQVPGDIVRDIVDVPTMTQSVAEKHRDEQYANLVGIEQVISLPTEFARAEAMHVIAGRSDSGHVQYLIFESDRIADRVERDRLLNILFFRLAEADPKSALAMSRLDNFRATKSIEHTVWRVWARNDLDDALIEAQTQTTVASQKLAAQSLYAAFGYMGNETTDRIESELGIGPDRFSRSRYLYQLADRSAAEAIEYINSVERGAKQQEYVSWLAHYLSLEDPAAALQYANLFNVASDGTRYSSIIKSNVSVENPQAAIERMLASGQDSRSNGEYYKAAGALAANDLDVTKQFFEQSRSESDKQILGSAIVSQLIKNDPMEALMWARENEASSRPSFEMRVLLQISTTDAQLAMAEAMKNPNAQSRSMLLSTVVQNIAESDPLEAVSYLSQIQNQQQRLEVSQQLASTWIRRDPDAALDWITNLDEETERHLMQQASYQLLRNDIDTAIRLLPMLEESSQMMMRQQIAERLATNYSIDEAQTFIRQFQGQPDFEQLQASIISGLAKSDALMAKQLADQLTDDNARNTAYVQIIAQRAQTDPREAARWLSSVSKVELRSVAAGRIAIQWYANDPAAATRWVSRLTTGQTRDTAIMHMSSAWSDPTAEQEDLIASIEDQSIRGQAKMRQIYHVMRSNPAQARAMMSDPDISSEQRQQLETMISRYGSSF